jgi:hypothetical protein
MFGPNIEEVARGLQYEYLYKLYDSPNIIRKFKLRIILLVVHVACIEAMRNA